MTPEKMTCNDYVGAFISNQHNTEEWQADYQDGMSVKDIVDNDSVDVFIDDDGSFNDTDFVLDITDIDENFDTKYDI